MKIIKILTLTILLISLCGVIYCKIHEKELYDYYTLKCWGIAINKYKEKKQCCTEINEKYYKLVNVTEKCNNYKANPFVK